MSLYNLKSSDGQWRITKFTNDLDVEASYITSEAECECPAGSRPTCRHRQMLPKMLHVGAEDSGMFYDFDHDQFLEPIAEAEDDTQPVIVSPLEVEETIETLKDMASELTTNIQPTFKAGELIPKFLDGMSQTVTTTINYMEDGTIETIEHKPATAGGPAERAPTLVEQTSEMLKQPNKFNPVNTLHPSITGTLKRRI